MSVNIARSKQYYYLIRISTNRSTAKRQATRVLHALVVLSLLVPNLTFMVTPAAVAESAQLDWEELTRAKVNDQSYVTPTFTHPEPRLGVRPEDATTVEMGESIQQGLHNAPVMFVENVGQFDPQARFQIRGVQSTIFFAPDAIWVSMLDSPSLLKEPGTQEDHTLRRIRPDDPLEAVNLRLSFADADPDPQVIGFDPLDVTVSYFIGKDPKGWHADVPVWGGVRYVSIYPGIDLEITSENGQWMWRFVEQDIPPEAFGMSELSGLQSEIEIHLKVDGADNLRLDGGLLRMETNLGEVSLPLVEANESIRSDKGEPRLVGTGIQAPLISDTPLDPGDNFLEPESTTLGETPGSGKLAAPVQAPYGAPARPNDLLYSTYLGTGGYSYSVAVDSIGATYLTGFVLSADFPTTPGSYQETDPGGYNAFVTKLNPSGTELVYSTYLGGSGENESRGIAIDDSGAAYIVGRTLSYDFPTTGGAYKPTTDGSDAFVTKLNPTGTDLEYSTYLGGTEGEQGFDVVVDGSGAAAVVGQTFSTDFPTTSNTFDATFNGGFWDGFLTQLNPSGSDLVYSTYIGGSSDDCEQGLNLKECTVEVDEDGDLYVSGKTGSSNFPTTLGAYDRTYNGNRDAFITKFDPSQSGAASLVYSTFLGGSGEECNETCDITVDSTGAVYIVGSTTSTNFPTENAFDTSHNGGWDTFITKLNPSGDALTYSTYLGDSNDDSAHSVAVNDVGEAYVVGYTSSTYFPTTDNGAQICSSCPDDPDAFVTRMHVDGNQLSYSTYLGGDSIDYGFGIAIDVFGIAYVTGRTDSTDFPTTDGAYQTTKLGGSNPFVSKLVASNTTIISDEAVASSCQVKTGGGDIPCRESVISTESGTQENEGDPINTRTGGLDYAIADLSIPTTVGTLAFVRSYSSLVTDIYTTELGYGWTHNHDIRLIFASDPGGQPDVVLFKANTANQYTFTDNGDGTYDAVPGVLASLTQDDGPPVTYTVVDSTQRVYSFDANGKISSFTDAQGHTLHYVYDAGLLDSVEDDTGDRYLTFTYDAQERIIAVTDHTGREVVFAYDGAGDLITVTDILGNDWDYGYDSEHRLTTVTNPHQDVTLTNEYDAEGRAVRQYDGLDNLIVELTYNPDGTTTVEDAFGNQETHTYSGLNTISAETDALGGETYKSFDPNFRPIAITDEDGDFTQLGWSADGDNLTQVVDAAGNQTDLTYDELNNLTEVIDPRGYQTDYEYDGTLLAKTTDAFGEETDYTYTPEGFLESVTDALDNTTGYTYDQYGQRSSITDALGNTWTYTYDDLGRLVETEDPQSRVTRNEYDDAGRLVRVTRNYDPALSQNEDDEYNIVTEYVYDEVGNQVEVIDTYGNSTEYEYDDANRLVRMIDPAGNETTNTYDEAGNLIATTDALWRTTTYTYDELDRLVASIDALGNTTTTAYNPDGTVASTTDALGRTTTYTYDDLKRVVATTDPLSNTTTTEYDESGNVVTTTDALGRETNYEHDALGRMIIQTDPEGGETEHFYDEVGNRVQTIDPNGHATTYEYDELNRLINIADALGNSILYAYNNLGQRSSTTDANGHTTHFFYDGLGRLVETEYPLGNSMDTFYDALGNVVERIDAYGFSTTYIYDDLNRLTSITDALDNTTSFAYDAVGNQVTVTDANDHTTTTTYDALNRPVTVTDAKGNVTTTTYDEVGNVIAIADGLGNTTTFAYDELNRQESVTDPEGNTTAYAYDDAGSRISMTDAEGVVTRYEYDDLNRLSAVVENYDPVSPADHETNVRTEYTYDAVGNRLTIADANDHVTTFEYDELNRLESENDPLGNTTSYIYEAVGNRVTMTDANGFNTSYEYDDLNRLETIDYPAPDADVTFTYDDVGRRTQMTDGVGTTTWAYDDVGRATAITDPFGDDVGYSYDGVGNRTSLTYPDGKMVSYNYDDTNRLTQVTDWESYVTTYTYDAADRLATVTLPNDVISTYSYDAAGRLLSLEHSAGLGYEPPLSTFTYTYDAVGNRVQVVEDVMQTGSATQLLPQLDFPFFDDMEAGTEFWTAEGDWELVDSNYNSPTHAWYISTLEPNTDESLYLEGFVLVPMDAVRPELSYVEDFSLGYMDNTLAVEISTDFGQTWVPLAALDNQAASEDWIPRRISLQGYQGLPVRVRFRAEQGDSADNEWYVDDIALHDRGPVVDLGFPFFDDAETGSDNWIADGEWALTGDDFHSPGNAWSYNPDELELPSTDFSLELDGSITIPGDAENPKLSYYETFDLDDAAAAVEVTTDNGQSWTVLASFGEFNGDWEPRALPLDGFQGETLRLRFRVVQPVDGYYPGTWLIDDVRVEVTSLPDRGFPFYDGFDSGADYWLDEGNWWLSDSNPHSPPYSWVWYADEDQYGFDQFLLLDGTITIPGNAFEPELSFYERYDLGASTVLIQVSDDGGGSWATLYAVTDDYEDNWNLAYISLDDYQGETIRIRIEVDQDQGDDVSEWFIDDVNVSGDIELPDLGYPFFDDMEDGADNWEATGEWYLNDSEGYSPTHSWEWWYDFDQSGNQYLLLDGTVDIPAGAANPVLSYYTLFDYDDAVFLVDITTDDHQSWTNIYYEEGWEPDWEQNIISLDGYQDETISIRFRVVGGEELSENWRIDDVRIGEVQGAYTLPGGKAVFKLIGAPLLQSEMVTVTVEDTDGTSQVGLPVYVFDGMTYTGLNGTTDQDGQVAFSLEAGSYRFRSDLNGTQFWSGETNHCTVPGCMEASVTVTIPVTVTVEDQGGTPQAGIHVYTFDGSTYTGFHGVTDGDGEVIFTLPQGNYRFRADADGNQFWSGEANHCTVPGCLSATVTITLTNVVTVTVEDTDGTPQEGLLVYVFDGTTYTGLNGATGLDGQVDFNLLPGSYRFRADLNGTQFWSGEANHCTVPGCTAATITVTIPVTVTVKDQGGSPQADIPVYVFDGTTYAGFNGTTDGDGEVEFTLPQGDYRFRADADGNQFWSGETNHCTVPGCLSATVTITLTNVVTVTVEDTDGTPQEGLLVYVFDDDTYLSLNGTTDEFGQVDFNLLPGSYRFRADLNDTQFWSGETNHCTVPGCTEATVTVTIPVTVMVEDQGGTPQADISVYVFDGTTYTGFNETSNVDGQVVFTLPQGDYRFRADADDYQFWSGEINHCTVPGCTVTTVTITLAYIVTVTVEDTDNQPKEGLPVYVFDGMIYTDLNGTTGPDGQVDFNLLPGSYRFRSDLNGTHFWSDEVNHCTVPDCDSVAITVTIPVTVTVQDDGGNPQVGLTVYVFDDTTYTGFHGTTNGEGEVTFTLPQGDYRFRSDVEGFRFFSDMANHCTIPGCLSAVVKVTLPEVVTVTVQDTDTIPQEGLPVYVFDGDIYLGFHGMTNELGQIDFSLLPGDYRFRSDLNGTHFWSGEVNHCTVPGCTEASVTVTIPVTVTVETVGGTPQTDVPVYAFDGGTYTGFHGVTDGDGEVILTLPEGNYRFRADVDDGQYWSGESNHCTIPGCISATVIMPAVPGEVVSTTIDYSYDPLYRLTAADYSSGEYFHYTYDAVGNRLTQETHEGTNTYAYDIANRLIEVDGVEYTWDDNGNLLSDSVSTYTYDHANRLKSVIQGDDTYTFAYNGQGDRLQQAVNGIPTEYTLDLNVGLTQVLDDGTNAYLYGLDRVGEEQPAGWAYHVPDALGSVRQLTDAIGKVTLAQSYEPFGSVMTSIGSGETNYSYTGEWADGTGLVHLRARYYVPVQGRLIARDLWPGDTRLPISLNKWLYAFDNPINYVDKSGAMTCRYQTNTDRDNYLRRFGWSHCSELPELIIDILGRPTQGTTSRTLWGAIQRWEPQLTVEYCGDCNPQGGRRIFGDPLVRIPSAYVPQAQTFRSNLSSLSNNQLVYVSVIAHEFWHATMQMPGTQHLGLGEADAFAAQALILEELGGDPKAVEYWVLQAKAAWDRSIWQSVLEAAIACVSTSLNFLDRFEGLRVLIERAEWKLQLLEQ